MLSLNGMLLINKGQSKNWYVTLTEKVTLTAPYYFLFSFKHRQTNEVESIILTDISTHTDRFNKFAVTEGATFVLNSGDWYYTIYAQTSNSNTDPSLANELVEQGILKCIPALDSEYSHDVELTEYMYGGVIVITYRIAQNGDQRIAQNGDKRITE